MAFRPLRESLVTDISEGTLTQRRGIGPCERLRGLAYSTDLARAIKRLQAGATSVAVSTTVAALDATVRQASPKARALPAEDRGRICLIAVLERLDPRCRVCNGRREVRAVGMPVIQCGECSGSGLRRFTNSDRERVMKRPLTQLEETVLEAAASLYLHHDSLGESMAEEAIYGDEE